MTIFAPSDNLGPNLIILVYPPGLALYLGAISVINFLTIFSEKSRANDLLVWRFPALARVISFSTKEANSFALALVVLIFSFNIKLLAKDFRRAFLWSRPLLSFLPFFLFRMLCLFGFYFCGFSLFGWFCFFDQHSGNGDFFPKDIGKH